MFTALSNNEVEFLFRRRGQDIGFYFGNEFLELGVDKPLVWRKAEKRLRISGWKRDRRKKAKSFRCSEWYLPNLTHNCE